jgi:hypothetical protein
MREHHVSEEKAACVLEFASRCVEVEQEEQDGELDETQ